MAAGRRDRKGGRKNVAAVEIIGKANPRYRERKKKRSQGGIRGRTEKCFEKKGRKMRGLGKEKEQTTLWGTEEVF